MDTVADMLTSLVNAQRVGKERMAVPHSRFKEELARLLHERGVVDGVRVQDGTKAKLIVKLAYEDGRPKVHEVHRLSKPGRRHYITKNELPYTGGRPGFYVISTSQGLMDEQAARRRKLGGELICVIWKS